MYSMTNEVKKLLFIYKFKKNRIFKMFGVKLLLSTTSSASDNAVDKENAAD